MTKLRILAFGIARDIVGSQDVRLDLGDDVTTVGQLKTALAKKYPELQDISSYLIALNNNYAVDADTVQASDEIALIPPVSGG